MSEEIRISSAKELGAEIRARRKRSRLRIDDAAGICNVSVQFLHDLETGKPTVQFDKAIGVARMMGIQLFCRPEEGDDA